MAFISTLVRASIGLAALAVLYEIYAGSLQNPLFFPTLSAAGRKAIELSATAEFQRHIVTSATILTQGLLPATFVGILAGLVLGASTVLRWVFGPLVLALAGVPMAALAPLTIMWLGAGTQSRVLLVGLFAALPIVRTVMVGAAAGRGGRTAPAIAAGLRWGLLLGVTGLVFGEMVGATAGIGYFIMQSMQRLDMASTLAGVLTLAVPVTLAIVFLEAIEAQLAT
jgi:ABC-type nitrate/sulfonate/bicarbonate transport system permease component